MRNRSGEERDALKNEILEWVRETVERLKAGADLAKELPPLVDYVSSHLDLIGAGYEGAPDEVHEALAESVELFQRSLECLETYLETANPKLLGLAVSSAKEATDLLGLARLESQRFFSCP